MAEDSSDDLVDRVANDMAIGRAIDWKAEFEAARTDEEREHLEALRLVLAIGQQYERGDPSGNGSGSSDLFEADETLPRDWGRFRLLELLGRGTFGSVYRAHDPDLDCEVAIKIMHRHVADSLLKERLLKEGRTLAKFRHPNIVRVLGVESFGDEVGLRMDLIRGETLEAELGARSTFSQGQASEVGSAICQALSAVHRAGFVHRDVKARNIMRERDTGRIVLMDFGTGREIDPEMTPKRLGIEGTAVYMAPELLDRQPASPCTDVYSVGVLLYFLLTGTYPVEGSSLAELEAAHVAGLRKPLSDRRPDLPAPFIHVVERSLAPRAQRRYATPGALFEELERASVPPRPTWQRYLAVVTSAATATSIGLISLGVVSSRYFNAALGRSEFVNDTFWDWLSRGAEASVAPIVLSIFAVTALAVIVACKGLVTAASTRARAFEKAVMNTVRRCSLDQLTNLSSCVLIVSVCLLVVTWWYFAPLLGGLVAIDPDISTAPVESLSLLTRTYGAPAYEAPANLNYRDLFVWYRRSPQAYRSSFIWVIIATCLLWYPAVRLAVLKRGSIPRAVFAGGAAVLILSLLLLDFPYRVIYRSKFPAATWQDHYCYVIGERAEEVLLFCPLLPAPRNRTVSKQAIDFKRAGGYDENIFRLLSPDSDGRR